MADHRLPEALADLEKILRAGANVVSSGPVFLQYPEGVVPAEMTDPLRERRASGAGVSLWVNGIDPGFANDWLPARDHRHQRAHRRGALPRDPQLRHLRPAHGHVRHHGIRPRPRRHPHAPAARVCSPWRGAAWCARSRPGSTSSSTASRSTTNASPHPRQIAIASGTVEKGTAAALRFEVRGMRAGRAVIVLEHVTRLADDIGPDWPQPAGQGGYRVVVRGEPNYTVDLQLMGTDGDHNTGGLKATAMRLVNAVPAVVEASPGLLTALDLPLVTGRGLVV